MYPYNSINSRHICHITLVNVRSTLLETREQHHQTFFIQVNAYDLKLLHSPPPPFVIQ